MNKLKVWVVGRGIPNPKNKMLGSFELEQAQALSKAGVDAVYLGVSVRSARNLSNVGLRSISGFSLPVYSFNFPVGRIFPQIITDKVFDRAFSALAKRIIKEHGMPDIIHVHYPAQRPYGALRKLQKKGVKIVATEHWTQVLDMTIGAVARKDLAAFVSECDSFICVSEELKKSVMKLIGSSREIEVVPNLVNSYFGIRPKKKESTLKYVVSGRLVEHKQVDKVVKAFMEAFGKDENVSLTVAGGGKQYGKIKSIVREGSREDQIRLLGPVGRKKMAGIMETSDVLITYSRMETFCVPVIEAWMCGMPVIASGDIPVIMDNDDERLGIKVDSGNIGTLKKALIEMRSEYMDYDPGYISNYANTHFSEQAVSGRLVEIYEGIMKRNALHAL